MYHFCRGAILWSHSQGNDDSPPEVRLKDGQLVLENFDATEEDSADSKSLDALQEDIMEMITKL